MMHGHGKSDSPIVPTKPTNEVGLRPRRRWREGGWPRGICLGVTCSGHRAGVTCPARTSEYVRPERSMGVSGFVILIYQVPRRYDPRQEPDAVMPHVRIRAGGHPQGWSLPRQYRFPAMYFQKEFVDAGGLMSTGRTSMTSIGAGSFVDKILKGAEPAHLPVNRQRSSNCIKTSKPAKQIGLPIPSPRAGAG